MTLTELQDQVKEDLKLSADQLAHDAIITPDIHNKYNRMLMREKMALKKLERKYNVLYLQQWEYYRKKADPEVYEQKPLLKKIMDSDVKLYLAADEKLQELQAEIDAKEELVEFLKRVMEQINQRTWLIKNAIEYYKFTNNA